MRPSRVKTKLKHGEPVLITCCHFIDPSVYELVSLLGFDGIWLDLEHHSTSDETASNLMRAARVGASDVIARPAKGEFMRMGRLLEAGAQGIMYPRCESAEEAAELVRWAKFAPQGERGVDGANGDNPYCVIPMVPYLKAANEHTQKLLNLGAKFICHGADLIMVKQGMEQIQQRYAALGFTFDNRLAAEAARLLENQS